MAAHHADNDTANNLTNYTTPRDSYFQQSAIRSERSEQSNPGLRAAVLRRSEGTRFSCRSEDEVGGFQSAICSERSEQSNPGLRAAVLRRSEGTRFSYPSDDEVGGFQSAIRSERSEQSNIA
jgi:hypothetical protein